MPFEVHPSFDTPEDSAQINKYMNFYKFSSLITTSKLFFCRADKFSDPLEGCYPRKLYKNTTEDWKNIYRANNRNGLDEKNLEWIASGTVSILRGNYERRYEHAICSFCSDVHEYEALWKLYSDLKTGVCIRTNIGKLKKSFEANADIAIQIGKIKYISDNEASWGDQNLLDNLFWPYNHKIQEYKIEQEVRATIWEISNYQGNGARKFNSPHGSFVEVNLQELIEEVILSPDSDDHFKDLIFSLMKSCDLDSKVKITKSTLFDKPF